jgi:hypothetical protein
VTHNPVKGVKRPKVESYEGKTPALGDGQARVLLDAPGAETLKGRRDRAIRPAMATVPNALLLCLSTPYSRAGALWDAYRRFYGKESDVLIWQADTRTMNPAVPQRVIDAAFEEDPAAAAAEYSAEFRSDLEAFISQEAIDACVISNRLELPPVAGTRYIAFCDPAGGSGTDSMSLAIGHSEGERAVLDLIRERKPRFSPEEVVQEFSANLKRYGIHEVVGDRYGGDWPGEAFRKRCINYKISDKPKSEIYQSMLPALNSSRVELLDLKTLRTQLIGLERRTARSGRDSIDHRPGEHDDVVNAAAGCLIQCVPTVELTPDMFAQGTFSYFGRRDEGRNLWEQR